MSYKTMYVNANEILRARMIAKRVIADELGYVNLTLTNEARDQIIGQAHDLAQEAFQSAGFLVNQVRVLEARGHLAIAQKVIDSVGADLLRRRGVPATENTP